ncbi:hypothetical protein JCM11641_005212 [Rhodosporidiobolus odoratus]
MDSSEVPTSPGTILRNDLIRTFTTTSSTSASERIAAARLARDGRRREREGEVVLAKGGDLEADEVHQDVMKLREGHAENLPQVKVDVESLVASSGEGDYTGSGATPGSTNSSLVPMLRVQPTSDRSYTPSVPSTPARSLPPTSPPPAALTSTDGSIASPITFAAPPSSLPPSVAARRSFFELAEIPAYRPKASSPPIPSPTPTVGQTPPISSTSPSAAGGVVFSGGLMERLKAQRAAKSAAEARAKAAGTVGGDKTATVSSVPDETLRPQADSAGKASEKDGAKSVVIEVLSPQMSTNEPLSSASGSSTTFAFASQHTRPLPRSRSLTRTTSTASSSSRWAASPAGSWSSHPLIDSGFGGFGDFGSAEKEATAPTEAAAAAPTTRPFSAGEVGAGGQWGPGSSASQPSSPRGRRTHASTVYGRNGEEIDYDFTELSDVLEQSERSSLSTWRDSVHQQRRYSSTSRAGRRLSTSSVTRPQVGPGSPNFNRFAYSPSMRQQQSSGSLVVSASPVSDPPVQPRNPVAPAAASSGGSLRSSVSSTSSSRAAPKPAPASISSHSRSYSENAAIPRPPPPSLSSSASQKPEKRVDATAHLLGLGLGGINLERSGSTRSIFTSASSQSSASQTSQRLSRAVAGSSPLSPPLQSFGSTAAAGSAGNASPTRKISPEVARRAAAYGAAEPDEGPRSGLTSPEKQKPTQDRAFPFPPVLSSSLPSPTKGVFSPSASLRQGIIPQLPPHSPSLSSSAQPGTRPDSLENPFAMSDRRRTPRTAKVDPFQHQLGSPSSEGGIRQAPLSSPSSSIRRGRNRTWSEVESFERRQAHQVRDDEDGEEEKGGTTGTSEVTTLEREARRMEKAREERRGELARRTELFKEREGGAGGRSGSESVKENSTRRSRRRRSLSEPSSPRSGTLCEGYLQVPPTDALSFANSLARSQDWVERYCVLSADSLEFRPTDQNHQSRPIVVFLLSEVIRIEDEPDKPFTTPFRPFAVLLKDDERLYFSCESRIDRVRWVLALQDAVNAARSDETGRLSLRKSSKPLPSFFTPASPSPSLAGARQVTSAASNRTMTPPGSLYSETRGTIRSWRREPKAPLGLYDYPDDKKKGLSPRSEASGLRSAQSDGSLAFKEEETSEGRPRDLFALYGRGGDSSPKPSSLCSVGSDRPLPTLPSKDGASIRSFPSPTVSRAVHATHGHRRPGSDLSSYNTAPNEPPFRPTPTRPESQVNALLSLFSPSSMLPAHPSTRSDSSGSFVPSEEISLLHRDLRKLLDEQEEVEGTGGKRLQRVHTYRRLQDRLKAFQRKHGEFMSEGRRSASSTRKDEEVSLSQKVDYLLRTNAMLLQKQEEAAAFYADGDRAQRLAAEEKELAARLEIRMIEMLEDQHRRVSPQRAPHSPSAASVCTMPGGKAFDNATITTRAGVHSASEKLDWQRDIERFKNEARPEGSSKLLSPFKALPKTAGHAGETTSHRREAFPHDHSVRREGVEPFENKERLVWPDSFTKPPSTASASPNTVRQARETASRRLEGLSPLPSNRSVPASQQFIRIPANSRLEGMLPSQGGYFGVGDAARGKDPFAGSGIVQPSIEKAPPTPLQPAQAMPAPLKPYSEWSGARSVAGESAQTLPPDFSIDQVLWRIYDSFERQNGSLERGEQHQDRMSKVMGELAKYVTEDRQLRDTQFQNLLGSVDQVVQHVHELPQRLLASLHAAETANAPFPSPLTLPGMDLSYGGAVHENPMEVAGRPKEARAGLQSGPATAAAAQAEVAKAAGAAPVAPALKRNILGLNPNSQFAQLDRKIAAEGGEKASGTGGSKVKGPRMPGIRLWGAPDPVGDRDGRWGGGAVAAKEVSDARAADAALAEGAEKDKPPHGPVVEALERDANLGPALEAIAAGQGQELDAGALSLAVFEILQSMRDIQKKQADDEKKAADERALNGGLSLKEKAELEAKRTEIVKLEKEMQITAERTARVNELVAALAERTDKADAMLAEINENVRAGKVTTMDPALSAEVKTLLGGVRAGVDDHVKDFRGQLTNEVQRMFKEVGKLRDEKKTLQHEIAELMTFHAKQGGSAASPAAAGAAAATAAAPQPAPTIDRPVAPAPGRPSSGFFGPRPMP